MLCNLELIDDDRRFMIEAVCLRAQFDDKANLICNAIPSAAHMTIVKCDHCDNVSLHIFADCWDSDEKEMKQLATRLSNILEQ